MNQILMKGKKRLLITIFDVVPLDTEWDREDAHDWAVEPTGQQSSLPERLEEREGVQQWEGVQQREQKPEWEMKNPESACSTPESGWTNPESGWTNPESGSPYHYDLVVRHDEIETGSDHQ